jgi:hypothetical protein
MYEHSPASHGGRWSLSDWPANLRNSIRTAKNGKN